MLSSRDPENGENVDPSRKLPPQVLDGFADIDRWANEYFRGRFGQEAVGVNVSLVRISSYFHFCLSLLVSEFIQLMLVVQKLLTILTNNFYEAHMRVTDRIVERAMKNMRQRKGAKLEVEDFAFGFGKWQFVSSTKSMSYYFHQDLHMSQEMPFFVEANHRVHDTLEAHRRQLIMSLVSLAGTHNISTY